MSSALADAVAQAKAKSDARSRLTTPPPAPLLENLYGDSDGFKEMLVTRTTHDALRLEAATPANPETVTAPAPELNVWGQWRRAIDPATGSQYFYHVSGITSWTPPEGWGGAVQDSTPSTQETHQPAGFMYRDVSSVAQGPFTRAQLAAWRSVLPLELRVWPSTGSATTPSDENTQTLAEFLGDDSLLSLLRSGQLPLPHDASAAAVEAVLSAAVAAVDEGGQGFWEQNEEDRAEGGTGLSFTDLAAASLAGLPPDERAAALVPPKSSPKRAYDSAPILNKRTGRLTRNGEGIDAREEAAALARGANPSYFSSRLDAYCDTTKLEAWLKDVSTNKGQTMKANSLMWRALRDRKLALKKSLQKQSWLRD